MPTRIYNGPVPEVDLILADGVKRVKRGDPVEVSDVEATSLDEQGGDWAKPAKAAEAPVEQSTIPSETPPPALAV